MLTPTSIQKKTLINTHKNIFLNLFVAFCDFQQYYMVAVSYSMQCWCMAV